MTITCFAHKNVDCRERCNTQTVFIQAYYTLSIYKYVNYFNIFFKKIIFFFYKISRVRNGPEFGLLKKATCPNGAPRLLLYFI